MAKPSVRSLVAGDGTDAMALAELKALRKAQRESARRVEELKLRLLQLSENHWDQTVNILKRWIRTD